MLNGNVTGNVLHHLHYTTKYNFRIELNVVLAVCFLERVARIELAFPAWQAGALATVLYPHIGGSMGFEPMFRR